MKKVFKAMAVVAAMAFTLACFAGCGKTADPYEALEASLGNGQTVALADNCEIDITDGIVTIKYVDTSMSMSTITAAYGTGLVFSGDSSTAEYVQINELTLDTGESMQSSASGTIDMSTYTSTTLPEVTTFEGPSGTSATDGYKQTITNNVNASLDLFAGYLDSENLGFTVADYGFTAY